MSQGNNKSRGGNRSKYSSRVGNQGNGKDRAKDPTVEGCSNVVPPAMPREAPRTASHVTPSLLIDSWYAAAIADGHRCDMGPPQRVAGLDRTLETCFPRLARLASRWPPLRGLLWYLASRNMQRVVCPFASPGLLSFLLLESLVRRQSARVVLVEFLRPCPVGFKSRIKEALHARICRWLLARSVCAIQVMTDWEGQHYAAKYGLPVSLFTTIPFPMILNPSTLPALPDLPSTVVMASGRAACDWPTLFDAARDARWSLIVVCSQADRPQVERLNQAGCATVMSEVSPEQHAQLLGNTGVYALVLREQNASTGQVRLARAIEAGIPVVASDVRGLDGYLEDGITAVGVPPGDSIALRQAIDRLLGDRQAYRALRARAYEAMRSRSLENYVSRIKMLAIKGA